MLALFTATVFAFVVIASHGKQTSQAIQKMDRVMYSPRTDVEEALRQALRDSDRPGSVLRSHSLMRDIYGNDTLGGWVINRYTVAPDSADRTFLNPKGLPPHYLPGTQSPISSHQSFAAGGQIIEFTAGYTIPGPPAAGPVGGLNPNDGQPVGMGVLADYTVTIPPHFGAEKVNQYIHPVTGAITRVNNEACEFDRRVGCVLTVIDSTSALYNKSTRIVGYRRVPVYNAGSQLQIVYHRYQVLPFKGVATSTALDYFGSTASSGYNFIINGVPFSGTGTGYRMSRPAGYRLSTDVAGTPDPNYEHTDSATYNDSNEQPFALLPNPTDSAYLQERDLDGDGLPDYLVDDSTNEDYDAPDYQNMLLALEQWDGTAMCVTRSPSLHRPALANYWLHYLAGEFARTIEGSWPPSTPSWILAWTLVLQPYGPDGIPGNGDDSAAVPLADRDQVLTIKRRCLLRPLREDHPNFDGSNGTNWPDYSSGALPMTGVSTADQRLARLRYLAQEAWGAADLTPGETAPWFLDTNDDGLVDDTLPGGPDGVPDTKIVPWDVDNDGDGLPDSIWVDAGLPIRTLPDGRKIKPLVAILCIDQDGKLNLNTTGSTEHLHDQFLADEALSSYLADGVVYAQLLNKTAGATATTIKLERGQGAGTAEINLYPMFLQAAIDRGFTGPAAHNAAMTFYRQLLLGGEQVYNDADGNPQLLMYEGRYGELWQRRDAVASYLQVCRPGPGQTLAAGATSSSANAKTPEARCVSRMFGYPENYYSIISTNSASNYGFPLDLKGNAGIGLDLYGRPVFSTLHCVDSTSTTYYSGWNANAWAMGATDVPYEIMLGTDYPQSVDHNANFDNPFTIAEWEAILRRPDSDALRLPGRLRHLLDATVTSPYRRLATTESWDIPAPAVALTTELATAWESVGLYRHEQSDGTTRTRIRRPLHIGDLIAARAHSLSAWSGATETGITYPSGPDAQRIDISRLLSTELLSGTRMDLNRPFGNGLDDTTVDTNADNVPDAGNGVVDEPIERLLLAQLSLPNVDDRFEKYTSDGATFRFDHDNDGFEWRNYNTDNVIDDADHLIALGEHIPGSPGFDPPNTYRQAYARHLYVLMMALVDQDWYPHWDSWVANREDLSPLPSNKLKQRSRARAIAQWAVNVVDFRDSDSIMTPFEFDIYPFGAETTTVNPGELINTWDVDGDITTDTEPFRDVVWGCERPELLMTETLAFHDMKVSDEATDSAAGGGDDLNGTKTGTPDGDLDQKFLPQGSFFVEVYNPQSPTTPKPGELYDSNGVVLTRTTTGSTPVWRMLVTTRDPDSLGVPAKHEYLDPDEKSYDTAVSRTVPNVRERLVYFVPDTGSLPELGTVPDTFYPSEATALSIGPQRYAVVGPASQETKGPNTSLNKTTLIGPAASNTANQRRIVLDSLASPAVQTYGDGVTEEVESLVTDDRIHPPGALVIDQPRRLSVSEPTSVDTPYPPATWDPGLMEFVYPTPYDKPLDFEPRKLGDPNFADESPKFFGTEETAALTEDTFVAYRYVHLQRLADPLSDWDAVSNPYITVDTMPVDLSVFNSKHETSPPPPANYSFYSRQRGELGGASLWKMLPPKPSDEPLFVSGHVQSVEGLGGNPANAHVFAAPFSHSLGYVNHFFGAPLKASDYTLSDDFRGAPGAYDASDNFTPAPFSWLAWLNRPFANPLELLQTPATKPSQLLMSFETDTAGATPYLNGEQAFGHLFNFFFGCKGEETTPPPAAGKMNQFRQLSGLSPLTVESSDFYRLLEYVHVPSRFASSYVHGLPSLMVGQQLVNPGGSTAEQPPHAYHPPFNTIHTYREPGKVNLNTVFEPQVLAALMSDHMAGANLASLEADWNTFLGLDWTSFAQARQALLAQTVLGGADYFGLEDGAVFPLPTRMANPFRSFAAYNLVPGIPNRDDSTTPNLYLQKLLQEGVNSTLLRPSFNPAAPLDLIKDGTRLGLVRSLSADPHKNAAQNSFFRYLPLQRLSNLTTTRSNVYAIWITVGYFEVEKLGTYNPQVYPEGYTLGQELGVDGGDVTRHRAFYVIDRSIPVGFVPGEDLNTEEAILLRRFIE